MSGSRLRFFRQGDLAEGWGFEMLRRFAAVAPVPREEDFGIDAICTLLRPEGRKLFAENTFGVQVKARSVRRVEVSKRTDGWLRRLDIPFFFVSIDLKNTHARILPYEWTLADRSEPSAYTFFTEIPKRRTGVATRQPWLLSGNPSGRSIWLGPPIDEFKLADLADDTRVSQTRSLMKVWCELVARNIQLRRHGIQDIPFWKTGQPPDATETATMGYTTQEELRRTLAEISPFITKADELARLGVGDAELQSALKVMRKKARELGVKGP